MRTANPDARHQEFLRFLKRAEAAIVGDLDIHLVLDNYAAHKHPRMWKWLADRPGYHVHFTPAGSSWLNQVERWFAEITEREFGALHSAALAI